jgi:hypothetical protein
VKEMAKEKIVNITVTNNMKKQPVGVIFKKSSYYNIFGCGALFYVSIFFVVQDPGQFAASKLVLIFSKMQTMPNVKKLFLACNLQMLVLSQSVCP